MLAALSQHIFVAEDVVVIAGALASRLALSKFTPFFNLLVKLKSSKVFTILIQINPLGALSASYLLEARLELRFPSFRISLKLLWTYKEVYLHIFNRFLNLSINSSKELTLLEQRRLPQLLGVVLVVVNVLEL